MIVYRYKAYDYKGRLHTGNLFVPSEEEAIAFLLRNNFTPIEVKLLPKSFLSQILFRLFSRISFSQKIYLMRSLHLILKSGLALDKGLEVLSREAKGGVRDFLFYLNYNLQRGEPLHQAFSAFPKTFSQVEIETIKAGEISGNLVSNLERLAENLERQREIKNEIISSIIYPAIVLALAFGVMVLLITFVMPKINILLSQLTSNPPFFTRVLLSVSSFVNANLKLVIALLVFSTISCLIVIFWKKTRSILIRNLMKLPIFSKLYSALALSEAFFILRSLLGAGINLTQALKLTADSSSHPDIRQAFNNVESELRAGKKFGDALLKQEKIPVFASSILSVAGETGFLEEVLKIMEEYYLEEFRTTVKTLLNLLQPALLIFVGLIVGFVAVAVLVPIYQQISEQLKMQEGRGQLPGELR
jgi:type II secretory pathway component PulF